MTEFNRGQGTMSRYKCPRDRYHLVLYDHAFVCPRCKKPYWRDIDEETGEIRPAFVRAAHRNVRRGSG